MKQNRDNRKRGRKKCQGTYLIKNVTVTTIERFAQIRNVAQIVSVPHEISFFKLKTCKIVTNK